MIYRLYIGCVMYVFMYLCVCLLYSSLGQIVPQAAKKEIGIKLIYLLPE